MKLKVLIDNNTLIDHYFIGEPGVCYYIEEKHVYKDGHAMARRVCH